MKHTTCLLALNIVLVSLVAWLLIMVKHNMGRIVLNIFLACVMVWMLVMVAVAIAHLI